MIASILSLLGAVLCWALVVFARAVGGVLGVGCWVGSLARVEGLFVGYLCLVVLCCC